jgi:hypothetical protein
MKVREFANHLESVINTLGIYEGTYWDIILAGDGTCRIVGKSNGYEFHSVPNNDSVIYSSLRNLCKDFLFLDQESRELIDGDWYYEVYKI